jgi:exopolyphosphatase/guanosine-5'-triphosphate,3'-diphosphate pyrophosphatase
LRLPELDYLVWAASHLSVEQIVGRFGVKPKRAATLLPGALTYSSLMRWTGVEAITVSEYGIREGAVLEMAAGRIESWPV